MATTEVASADPLSVTANALVVGVFTGGIEGPGAEAAIAGLGLDELPLTPDFRGDIGQHLALAAPSLPFDTVVFVGLGRMVATDAERLRQAATVAARAPAVSGRVVTTLAHVHPAPEAVGAIAEGFLLGAATDRHHRSEPPASPPLDHVTILVPSGARDAAAHAVRRAEVTAAATGRARALVDAPPNDITPRALADRLAADVGASCAVTVRDHVDLARDGFAGLLGVAGASARPPSLLELRHEPDDPLGHVVLCGLGVTFDAGGLSLADRGALDRGKAAVAGAAAVAAACSALDALRVRVRVTALLGLVEHMPGGDAQRPGDVVDTRSGTTVEVTDPTAEHMLVLADLLDLARGLEPDAIVDVATVGRAPLDALGPYAAAVMGNDDDLVDALLAAAGRAGEPLWRLPLWDELDRRLRSDVADLVVTDRAARATPVLAGLFLRHFARSVPWAHIDCTGPAYVSDAVSSAVRPTGASGYATRTLLQWLEHRTAPGG